MSYGIYLYHAFCFLAVVYVVHFHQTIAGAFEQMVLTSVVSLGVAALSYHLFEQPILRLKERLTIARPQVA
ncbi:MAG: hypothetical protein ACREVO_13475 [Steroidobacteraceae bacterium]